MGRHYCVAGECLYIFTTGGEALLDLKAFPPGAEPVRGRVVVAHLPEAGGGG